MRPPALAAAGFVSLVVACSSAPPAPPQSAGTSYHAVAGRYRFAIPPAWAGHYSVDTLNPGDELAEHAGVRHMVSFTYQGADTTVHPPLLLALVTLSRAEWTRLTASSGSTHGALVAERPEDVIVAGMPGTNPFDTLSTDGQQFSRLRPTLEQVRAAVTLD